MLSPEEKKTLRNIAREAIIASLLKTREKSVSFKDPTLSSKKGVFVTLTQEGRLRGCIGRVEPELPLFQIVAEMARAAAFDDPRFPPLTLPELPQTAIEISVLSPLQRVTEPKALEAGRHGLLVRRGTASGLLLPQVASSYGWSIEEFLDQVCLKAGLPRASWQQTGTDLFSFTAEIIGEEDV